MKNEKMKKRKKSVCFKDINIHVDFYLQIGLIYDELGEIYGFTKFITDGLPETIHG